MNYTIVATLGPGSATEAAWKAMLSAGATGFRLNTSHLSLEQLQVWLDRIRAFLSALDSDHPLVLDLQGSKWRLGQFTPFELVTGQRIELHYADSTGRQNALPVPHADFFQAATVSNGEIALNDAKVRLHVESIGPDALRATVTQGGEISPSKGITLACSEYRREALSEKDQAILEETAGAGFIRYAISYVKDAGEMARYRELAGPSTYLIAKLERRPAIDEAVQIAGYADELWLCRGDLGAELGLQAMAEAVHRFSALPGSLSIPLLMAGQVLEYMTVHPTPTRSEVCYLYTALIAGYAGFVLSDETATGRYPVESCRNAALFKD